MVEPVVPVVKGIEVTDDIIEEVMTTKTITTATQYSLYQESSPQYVSSNTSYPYRGFSTSICSLFHSSRDCCSLAFCGLLQWDYNYYLLTHEYPPSLWFRACRHIFIPALLFLSAAFCATRIKDQHANELSTTILMLLFFVYIIADCVLEGMKRVKFRESLVDILHSNNNNVGDSTKPQSKSDLYCAHRICGFYSVDNEMEVVNESTGLLQSNNSVEGDICTVLWQFFARLCCGKCCACWCQCCGICAIAQEAREIEKYIGQDALMMDYVTFEPYTEYYSKILHLRFTKNDSLLEHYGSLSDLSILLLKTLLITIIFLCGLAMLDYGESFTWGNLLVFLATFFQAFVILYFVHWKYHRFDLSLDAVVKYFAAGFLISITLAFGFECLGGVVLNIFFNFISILSSTSSSASFAHDFIFSLLSKEFNKNGRFMSSSESQSHHVILSVIYIFFSSFVVAAFVEEMCKYYGYLMLDHPDMIQNYKSIFQNVEVEEDSVKEDLLETPALIQGFNALFQKEEVSDTQNKEDSVEGGYSSANSSRAKLQECLVTHNEQEPTPLTSDNDNNLISLVDMPDHRKLNSFGTGITIAMVAVATGFACCENLAYIFIYTGGSAGMEITVLIARSLFPVHPLCAAIQSIGVCRRVLENDTSYGVGRCILPALILHGSFDFVLMVIAFFSSSNSNDNVVNNDDNNNFHGETEGDDIMASSSFLISLFLVIIGFSYYYVESNKQKTRLEELDDMSDSEDSGWNYCCTSPM